MLAQHHQHPARRELTAYEAELPLLLKQHEGEYVVIKGDQFVRYFERYPEALEWAYDQFGLEPFFVKRIAQSNTVHFTRDLGPCRT